MPHLEITIPPQIVLGLDVRKVRAVLRSAGSEIAALARRKVRQSAGTGKTVVWRSKGQTPRLAAWPLGGGGTAKRAQPA